MPSRQEAHYFKIGLFILSGIVLLIALIVFLNTSSIFTKQILIETYFNESVQGLSVGSPVKYRGITIGHVKEISFVSHVYDLPRDNNPENRYIYVLLAITSSFLTDVPAEQLKANLVKDIQQGLRVKLALQDLTGNAYLEVNFTNPKLNPTLPFYWKPAHNYIPSTVSVLTRFADSVQNLLQGLQNINFQKFFDSAQNLITDTNKVMLRTDAILAKSQGNIEGSFRNTNATMGKVNNILSATQGNIINTIQSSTSVTNNMRQLSNSLKDNPAQIIFNRPQVIDPSKL